MWNKRAFSSLAALLVLVTAITLSTIAGARAQSPTATPAGRWGIYVDVGLDTWKDAWSTQIPTVWRNSHEESARYKLEVDLSEEEVQTCYYYDNHTVIRKRWNTNAVLTDLETGAVIGTTIFPGEDPRACYGTESFDSWSTSKEVFGFYPDASMLPGWLASVLPGTQTGLVVLTPTPTPTITPIPTATLVPTAVPALAVPADVAAKAMNKVTVNADWQPYTQEIEGVKMVLVPAGCFTMGSEKGNPDERPTHQVCFDQPFWLDVLEVYNEQFDGLGGQAAMPSHETGAPYPRTQIDFAEAGSYCASRGTRLPTEAEWEYAARGPDGLVYSWGNDFDSKALIFGENAINNQTWKVGSKARGVSWVGALDLIGNASEWVSDWYGPYSFDAQTSPTGPASGETHVVRGGSFMDYAPFGLRAAARVEYDYATGNYDLGFRCARSFGS